MNRIATSLVFLLISSLSFAQEIRVDLEIDISQLEGVETIQFESMERSIIEFLSDRRWTRDTYKPFEQIRLNLYLILENKSGDTYSGSMQVQSSRPVFGSNYNTPVFNYNDAQVQFNFTQFDILDFSLNNASQNELTALLAYYAYLALAYDYDSFEELGGTEHFQSAQTIVNQMQATDLPGWKAFDGTQNRYWIVENSLDNRFAKLRQCYYSYHRNGMDQLVENPKEARDAITEALKSLEAVHKAVPNSFNSQIFFTTKRDEILNIYSEGDTKQTAQVAQLLQQINPGNTNKWLKLTER